MPQAGAGALIGSAIIGGIAGIAGQRQQRRAAEAAAQPRPYNEQFQNWQMPYGPLLPLLEDLAPLGLFAAGTPLPSFPEFQSFNFHGLPAPDIHFADYDPIDLPTVYGASGQSQGIIRDILELARNPSGTFEVGMDAIRALESGEFAAFQQAQAMLGAGPLADLASGVLQNPYEEQVVDALRADAMEALDERLGLARGAASAVSASGSSGLSELEAQLIRESIGGDLANAIAQLRAGNFEQERGRQTAGVLGLAELAQGLAGLRQGGLQAAASAAPALERSRYFGFDIAGPLSLQADQLNQAAAQANAAFALQQALAEAQYDAIAGNQQLQLYGIQSSENALRNQLGFAEAGRLNDFNLAEFGFDVGAPFLRLNQLSNFLLPLAGMTSGTYQSGNRSGMAPGGVAPPYPSAFGAGLTGGLGGLFTGLALQNMFGGQQWPSFAGYPLSNLGTYSF